MMDIDEPPIIYGLEHQARCLTGLYGDEECIRFLVGSQSLRVDNQIHLVVYDEDSKEMSKYIFSHSEGEIWGLTASPFDPTMFVSTYCNMASSGTEMKMRARVWKLPDELEDQSDAMEDNSQILPLEYLCSLPTEEYGDVRCVIAHPSESDSSLVCLVDNQVVLCSNVDNTGYQMSGVGKLEARSQHRFTVGRWNPHHGSTQLATANDQTIRFWDLRTMKSTGSIESAHAQLVRDLDYNPNRQYYLASCGDDCRVRFWDVRQTSAPVHQLQPHSHWVWSVRYNPFHDQLALTASSDSRVCLHGLADISSEPPQPISTELRDSERPRNHSEGDESLHSEEEDEYSKDGHASTLTTEKEVPTNGLIRMYEDHEDSVYAAEWSLIDPWVFASLSYDGRLVINQVPKREKFKILL